MTVLTQRRTGNVVRDAENYMARERELGVWGFAHLVRYLRAIILKLTPQPHRCTLAVLDAAVDVLATNKPVNLSHLRSTPPRTLRGPAPVARDAANTIIEVIACWAGFNPLTRVRFRNTEDVTAERQAYEQALRTARHVEESVLALHLLTPDDLYTCAVEASGIKPIDANRRDAAVAAMSAGHFQLGHEIATDE